MCLSPHTPPLSTLLLRPLPLPHSFIRSLSLIRTCFEQQTLECQSACAPHDSTNPATIRCSVLQCVAVCCSVLQCVAVSIGMYSTRFNKSCDRMLQRVAGYCGVLQRVAVCCGVSLHVPHTIQEIPSHTHTVAPRHGVATVSRID